MYLPTKRLLLRDFEERDWQSVLAYQSDPLYLRYTPWHHRTELEVRSFVRMFIDWSQDQPRHKFQFAITLPPEGRLIGNIGIRMNSPHAWEAEMGYELDHRYWGHGYATEAALALLSFGFRDLHLHRIFAYCIAENTASEHVLQRIGMTYEGRLRECEWMKERWWDRLTYAILDHEWWARM